MQLNPSHPSALVQRVAALLCLLFLTPLAHAHAPFDNSAHAILSADGLEVSVTLGSDAAAKFLKASSPDNPISTGGIGVKVLPAEFAARLVELKSGNEILTAKRFQMVGDGLEYTFTAQYPRPASAAVSINSLYMNLSEEMKLGTLVLADENGRQIGSGVLTKGNAIVELPLPAAANPVVSVAQSDATNASQPTLASTAADQSSPAAKIFITFGEYLKMGVHHILTGPDHLLFLCGLLVVSRKPTGTLAIITSFTLAHSITLAIAALNIVSISAKIIEPLIAASIIFVGVENFRRRDSVKARCLVAFGFGLIHGFGLADALRDAGLGSTALEMVKGLLSFNLGVEIGQIAVAVLFLTILWQLRKLKPVERYSTPALSVVVIALGCWWLLERTVLSHPA